MPELALVEESCDAEIALHGALLDAAVAAVAAAELDALQDADARANYAAFVAFRDALLAAGTLGGYYLAPDARRRGRRSPPQLVDRVVEAIVRHLLDSTVDAFEARAGELLFRAQRLTVSRGPHAGRRPRDGRRARRPAAAIGGADSGRGAAGVGALDVLSTDNADAYWARSGRHDLALDLTHEVTHGARPRPEASGSTRAHSGLKALSRVLEKWVAHLLGASVSITPLREIDDPAWRWHVGLDAVSMALLNDLYDDRPVEPERLERPGQPVPARLRRCRPEMRADVAGRPVYLGLAMAADARSSSSRRTCC